MRRLPARLRPPRGGAPPLAGRRILITGGSSGIGLADALTQPVTEPHLRTGLPSRPSLLVKLRDLAGAGDR